MLTFARRNYNSGLRGTNGLSFDRDRLVNRQWYFRIISAQVKPSKAYVKIFAGGRLD